MKLIILSSNQIAGNRLYSSDCTNSFGSDSTNSFSFYTGLRSVLKNSANRATRDQLKHNKNVAFRSPIESAREASFDESTSTLVDGSSAESRELSFLACQLENAKLMQEDFNESSQNALRRNATQLKRQHFHVLRTLRNLAMQKTEVDSVKTLTRSQSLGDLTSAFTGLNAQKVNYNETETLAGKPPHVPKIFDPRFENITSDDSDSNNDTTLANEICLTHRANSFPAPTPKLQVCNTSVRHSRGYNPILNRELTRKHNEMNWKRRHLFQKAQLSPNLSLLRGDHGNLGLTVVGTKNGVDIASSYFDELSYRYRRKSR